MVQIVAHSTDPSVYLHQAFPDGYTPLEHLNRRIQRLRTVLEDDGNEVAPSAILLLPGYVDTGKIKLDVDTSIATVAGDRASEALRTCDQAVDRTIDDLVVLDLDAPFFSVDLARYLYRLHRTNWCDYTFGDGFPIGYAVQIVRREILEPLALLAESRTIVWNRTFLFDSLSVDINAFDIETEAAREDYALLRLNLTVGTRADTLLCRRLVERGVTDPGEDHAYDPEERRFPDDEDPLLAVLLDRPLLKRTLPRYYFVQVTEAIAQRPAWTPWSDERWAPPVDPRSIGRGDFSRMLHAIADFTPEAVVHIGYRGEPALHPELEELIATIAGHSGLTFYIETAGIGWSPGALDKLVETHNIEAVIVTLDAPDETTYATLRGTGYAEAISFIETVRSRRPGLLYIQAVRMEDNEDLLPEFFHRWNEVEGVQPLIEKYNSWAGRLADRRPADLTPIHRPACVHLERDLVITVDGAVIRCHQDLDREAIRGNILTDALDAIWLNGEREYADHVGHRYPPLCEKCDEYYTFNV